MGSPRNASASVLIFRRTIALSSWGVYDLFSIVTLWSVPILRLICITVRSGFRTAWRFAGSPTRICPSFVNAITDGNILPPYVEPSALGMIRGVPPSMYAASEFVVPRSIPMILGICFTLALDDNDLRGTQDAIVQAITLPDDLLNEAVRRSRNGNLLDAVVDIRIEDLSLRGDFLEAGILEGLQEIAANESDPVPRRSVEGRDRGIEFIEDGEELGYEDLVSEPHHGFHLPLRPLPIVLELRLEILQAGEEFLVLTPRVRGFVLVGRYRRRRFSSKALAGLVRLLFLRLLHGPYLLCHASVPLGRRSGSPFGVGTRRRGRRSDTLPSRRPDRPGPGGRSLDGWSDPQARGHERSPA